MSQRTASHSRRPALATLAATIPLIVSIATAGSSNIRVDGDNGLPNPSGTGGDSWQNAYKYLADAIADATSRVENDPAIAAVQVWVAATDPSNPYAPDAGSGSPGDPFRLHNNVSILGGFLGAESFAFERDPIANVTVLTGIGASQTGRILELGVGSEPVDDLVIDGFTVRDGIAPIFEGGAALLQSTSETFHITRCRFVNNLAALGGAVVVKRDQIFIPNPIFALCEFVDNLVNSGSGIGGGSGGGAVATSGSSVFYSCLFDGNVAQSTSSLSNRGVAGAIYQVLPTFGAGTETLRVTNCTFVDNMAMNAGDTATGGAIRSKSAVDITIENSIFWGNRHDCPETECTLSDPDPIARQQIYVPDAAMFLNVMNCLIEDQAAGDGVIAFGGTPQGNLDRDPVFLTPGVDFRLASSSPAINAGSNSATLDPVFADVHDIDSDGELTEPMPDLDLRCRIIGLSVDMGAYETLAPCAGDFDNNGEVNILDLLAVLGNWGNAGPLGDANGDGVVDLQDLLTVLAGFGPCGGAYDVNPPSAIQDCITKYGVDDPARLQACIQAMLLAETP